MRPPARLVSMLIPMAVAAGAGAEAQQGATPAIGVELNKLEPIEGGCRAYLVLDNAGGALATLDLDLVLFDAQGVIVRRLAVEAGPVRPARMAVKAFVIDGLACAAVDRVLLNDVLACEAAEPGSAVGDCFSRIAATSRADADFVK
jgi:hypothetical protein